MIKQPKTSHILALPVFFLLSHFLTPLSKQKKSTVSFPVSDVHDFLESTTVDACHRSLTFPSLCTDVDDLGCSVTPQPGTRSDVVFWYRMGPYAGARVWSWRYQLSGMSQGLFRQRFFSARVSIQEHPLSFWRFKIKLLQATVWGDFTEMLTTSPPVQQYQWWNPLTLARVVYLDMWWLDLLSWPLWVFQKAFR